MTKLLPTHLQPYEESIEGLRRIGRLCWERGWSRGTSSNYSVVVNRNPTQILVTASGKDKGNLAQDDFVLVNDKGQPVVEGVPNSSGDTVLNCVCSE
jgi:methylthioribulose-1-phosphate dehydratase